MADRKKHAQTATKDTLGGDSEAGLIHDLATAPPAKDIASVKAASDAVEASREDEPSERKVDKPAALRKTGPSARRAAFSRGAQTSRRR